MFSLRTLEGVTLGGNYWDSFKDYGLNVEAGLNYISNPYEKAIAEDGDAARKINAGVIPAASWLGTDANGVKNWSGAGQEIQAFGLDPQTYKIKVWFYPVQTFLKIFAELRPNYPDTALEPFISICFYNWLAKYAQPSDEMDALIYSVKLNTLKELINGLGYSGAWKNAEAEINRKAQAAAAQAAAAQAAEAYAKAQREKAAEAEKLQTEIDKSIQELQEMPPTDETATSTANILPLAIIAGAALIFLLRGRK